MKGAPAFIRELVDWGAGLSCGAKFLINGGKLLAASLKMASVFSFD